MFVPADQFIEQPPSLTRGDREHTETEIEHVDWPAVIEVPAMPNSSR